MVDLDPVSPRSELEARLTGAYQAARARWPDLALSADQYVRYVSERLPAKADGPSVEALHLDDLYLACACAAGVPGAVDALERDYLKWIPGVLAHQRRSPETIAEVCQKLREALLLKGRLSQYSGEGKLLSWIEVVARRMANREDRARGAPAAFGQPVSDSGVTEALEGGGDLERDVIKRRLVAELQVAVRVAGAVLSDEQRALLRFHYRNGMTEARLAKLFNTSQPTISRRLSKAKELVFAETRRGLQQRLHLGESDFESFIDEIRSRWLDLSLGQVFGSSDGSGRPPA